MKRITALLLTAALLLTCTACTQAGKANLGLTAEVKPATDFTAKSNAAVYDKLDFNDKQEYEFATRGLIDAPETLELKDKEGNILWSQEAYAFLDEYEKAPDVTRQRLYYETMEEILAASKDKTLLDSGVSGKVLPHMPLPGTPAFGVLPSEKK